MLRTLSFLLGLYASALLLGAQNPAFEFYSEFRGWSRRQFQMDRTLTEDQLIDKYAQRLRSEGVGAAEVNRRVEILRNSKLQLEDDFWNRFFSDPKTNYNRAPNAFLVEVVQGRKPGTALDYGMGEGRNALYLAKLGWQVSGFDPAAEAVSIANRRARELGLSLDTKPVRDTDYDFGQERFDLVLFSWTMPEPHFIDKVVRSLKPGGLVVMECGASWVGRNQMLRRFDPLQIVRYEIVTAKSDFFNRNEMEVLRLVARKN
ncbi:MAG: class I SAM-dependent methyltransferase [Bryobacteraceae bacterium]|nr:class I SAM-dependent methyltransferase [Bryobacteraceae bacterium]